MEGQFSLVQTGIEKVDDGLNRRDECVLGVGEDGDDDIEDMRQLRTSRHSLILTDRDECLVHPIANPS